MARITPKIKCILFSRAFYKRVLVELCMYLAINRSSEISTLFTHCKNQGTEDNLHYLNLRQIGIINH